MSQNEKNHYIAILPNKFGNLNIGTLINIKTFIAGNNISNVINDYLNHALLNGLSSNAFKFIK